MFLLHAVLLLQLQLPLKNLPALAVLLLLLLELQLQELLTLHLQLPLLLQPQPLLLQPLPLLPLLLLPVLHLPQLQLVLLQPPQLLSTSVAITAGVYQRRRGRNVGKMCRKTGIDGPPVSWDQRQVVAVGYGAGGRVVLVLVVFLGVDLHLVGSIRFFSLLVSCETVKITCCIQWRCMHQQYGWNNNKGQEEQGSGDI